MRKISRRSFIKAATFTAAAAALTACGGFFFQLHRCFQHRCFRRC